MSAPLLAVTLGDPVGIGPEITARALSTSEARGREPGRWPSATPACCAARSACAGSTPG